MIVVVVVVVVVVLLLFINIYYCWRALTTARSFTNSVCVLFSQLLTISDGPTKRVVVVWVSGVHFPHLPSFSDLYSPRSIYRCKSVI